MSSDLPHQDKQSIDVQIKLSELLRQVLVFPPISGVRSRFKLWCQLEPPARNIMNSLPSSCVTSIGIANHAFGYIRALC